MSTRKTVVVQGPEDRQQIATWARNVDVGTIVEFRKKTRSHEQSAKMHAMLGEVANQVVWYGTKLLVEDWKNMFTASLRKAQVVPGIDAGTVVPLGIHTSTMTVDEMSNMIEAIYAFGSDPEHLVVFKDPQEQTNSNPAGDAPSEPAVDGAPEGGPAPEAAGDAPSSAAALSDADLDWLKTAATMLWGATPVSDNTEECLRVLHNQRLAIDVPDVISRLARDKAGSIYTRCKACIMGETSRGDTLRYIANMAGVDVSELETSS